MAEFKHNDGIIVAERPFAARIDEEQDLECFNCGSKHPSAYWVSRERMESDAFIICKWCAIEILPRLLADAISAQMPKAYVRFDDFSKAIPDIERNFWFAAAAALSRANDAVRKLAYPDDEPEGIHTEVEF